MKPPGATFFTSHLHSLIQGGLGKIEIHKIFAKCKTNKKINIQSLNRRIHHREGGEREIGGEREKERERFRKQGKK